MSFIASPLGRVATIAPYSYTATTSSVISLRVGTGTDIWLSTNVAADTITLNAIPANVRGIGGRFFVTDFDGARIHWDRP